MLKQFLNTAAAVAICACAQAAPHAYIEVDSITNNLQDFNYLTAYTEANYAAFPAIINSGFGTEYDNMKAQLKSEVGTGKIGIKQATCEYAYWINSQFDAHYYVNEHVFWQVYKRRDTPDYKSLMTYEPQKLSTRVDKRSWLIRVPSCTGNDPSFEWMAKAVDEFMKSKCKNLIIDLRGNSGGDDNFWAPLLPLLIDHKALTPEEYWFRNTSANRLNNQFPDLLRSQINGDNTGKSFLLLNSDEDDDDEDEAIPEHNAKIHISFIIDRKTASAAETILRVAKNFTARERYAIYGKENSAGAAYTGNLTPLSLPHSGIQVFYPVSVSSTFLSDKQWNGASGIQPDVKINMPYPETLSDNIDSWVTYVARQR